MFDSLSDKLTGALRKVTGYAKLSEKNVSDALAEVRMSLLEADVNFQVAKDFIAHVKERALGEEVQKNLNPSQMFVKIVHEELVKLLGQDAAPLNLAVAPPMVILMAGLQGSGKTTSAGKLAMHLRDREKRSPLLVPADVYRPAAIDQLRTLGERMEIPVADSAPDRDPVQICTNAIERAKREGLDVVILDTAGRLQVDEELMAELERIVEATQPTEVLFVADSMTGQEAVNVSKAFDERLALDGIILTKLDGDARGGAALSIKAVTGKPIKFVGVGEKAADLEPFYPDRMASRILGMGDVLSLIEKAEREFDEKQAEKLEKKMRRNEFDLEDFRDSIVQMKKLGSVESIFKMLPGVPPALKKAQNFAQAEQELKRVEAIINSMTPRERQDHKIINGSRRKRIAAGSGTKVQDVNRLLKSYLEMRKMMKKMNKFGMPNLGAMMGGKNPF
ncbi:MAG: signal recognition particle protein [Chrysiogenetes bacterium]|nr:signal recognition particle protein [Chrysiogenetes bacterium]